MRRSRTAFFVVLFGCIVTSGFVSSDAARRVLATPHGIPLTGRLNKSMPVVKPAKIIDRVRVKMNAAESISARQLAAYANELLKKDGYDFTFDWEPKGKTNEANLLRAGEEYYPFYQSLVDAKGKRRAFQFLNKDFGHPCFSVIDIPVTSVSGRTMTMVSDRGEFEVVIPNNFGRETIALVDREKRRTIRTWNAPIDVVPIGISADGRRVFFETWEFHQDQTAGYAERPLGLAMELSDTGSLRFVDVKDIPSDKGADAGYDKKNTAIYFRKYKVKGREYVIRSSGPCT